MERSNEISGELLRVMMLRGFSIWILVFSASSVSSEPQPSSISSRVSTRSDRSAWKACRVHAGAISGTRDGTCGAAATASPPSPTSIAASSPNEPLGRLLEKKPSSARRLGTGSRPDAPERGPSSGRGRETGFLDYELHTHENRHFERRRLGRLGDIRRPRTYSEQGTYTEHKSARQACFEKTAVPLTSREYF